MEEQTCPNCNVDVDSQELKQNNLHCPTCGFDMSDAGEPEEIDDDEDEDDDEEEEDEEEEKNKE